MNAATTADKLQELYLHYLNDYLTVAVFAQHHELTMDEAHAIITAGRAIHNHRTDGNSGAATFVPTPHSI